MKKLVVVVSLLCVTGSLLAQNPKSRSSKEDRRAEKRERINAMVKQEEEGVLAYYKQTVFGLKLRTDGYAAFLELGRMKTPRFANLYSFELSEIKHPKEERFQNIGDFFGNSYIYGKSTSFYQAKLGFGQQYILGQKGNKNGVAVMAIYSGGFSAGLEKPYYLLTQSGQGTRDIKFQDDSATFLNHQYILGSSGFSKGLSEINFNPGAFAQAALRFDFGRFNESVQAIEIGISADYYSKKVEIMAFNPGKNLFVQGHLAIMFGRRK